MKILHWFSSNFYLLIVPGRGKIRKDCKMLQIIACILELTWLFLNGSLIKLVWFGLLKNILFLAYIFIPGPFFSLSLSCFSALLFPFLASFSPPPCSLCLSSYYIQAEQPVSFPSIHSLESSPIYPWFFSWCYHTTHLYFIMPFSLLALTETSLN